MKRYFAIILPAVLVLSVLACKDEVQPNISPAPDASVDNDSAASVDASVDAVEASVDAPADAADAGLCTGYNPNFVPPPFNPKNVPACAPEQIDSYVAGCTEDDYAPDCLKWKADASNAACLGCIFRPNDEGPFRLYADGTFAAINDGACLAMMGFADCGKASDASFQCEYTACKDCPADAGIETGACYDRVGNINSGDCKPWLLQQVQCESPITGSAAECVEGQATFAVRYRKVVTLLCGMPSDGGDTDAGDAAMDAASDATGD